ncbi:SdrD B-like domain-containing protein, partial [Staphylococcus epidermidis]|uniref:SdrD B-like domain-containing protein n=1 Tax=Staphylococcus epidermidis TaxID=1282 RepID=UPI000AD283EC
TEEKANTTEPLTDNQDESTEDESIEAKKALLTEYITSNSDVSEEEAKAEIQDIDLQDVDFSNANENTLLSTLVKNISNKKEEDEKLATPRAISRIASPVMLAATDNVAAQESGTNVNNKIDVTSLQTDKNTVRPNDGEGFSVTSTFKVNGKVNEGDYFTVDMPDYANFNGIADYTAVDNKIYPTIKDGEQVVANGVYDVDTKKLKYTFTDYVNNKQNIEGGFKLPQYIDRKTATQSGDYNLNYNVAGNEVNIPISVQYDNYRDGHVIANATSLITNADIFNTGSHEYTQYIYVNPQSVNSYDTWLTIQGYQNQVNDSSAIFNSNDTSIEIFDAESSSNINPSFYVNDSNYRNVTSNYQINETGDKQAKIYFGHIDHPYIVKVTSKIDPNSTADLKTRIRMDNKNYRGTTDYYIHDNTVERSGANGIAQGDEGLYNLGDYVWEDTNKNGIQDSDEQGIEGVTVTLTRPNGTTETTTTDSNGKYQFSDLQNGSYVINFQTPEGYTPTKSYQGMNTEVDSNGLSTVGIINDADNWTLDSGFYKTPVKYSLGDYVWYDSNQDGIQDYEERGIEGVTVTLTHPDGTVETTTTDSNGKYQFDNLDNGDYTVHFEKPTGLTQTVVDSGNDDAKDADGETVKVTIKDHDDFTIDNGYFESTSDSESQ